MPETHKSDEQVAKVDNPPLMASRSSSLLCPVGRPLENGESGFIEESADDASDDSASESKSIPQDDSGSDHKPVPGPASPSPKDSKKKVTGRVDISQRGIYTLWQHVPAWKDSIPGGAILGDLEGFVSCWPYVKRLMRDLWRLGPFLCLTYAGASVVQSFLPAIKLAQSAHLLKLVSTLGTAL